MNLLEKVYAEIKRHGTPANYSEILEAISNYADDRYKAGADMGKMVWGGVACAPKQSIDDSMHVMD